MKKILLAALASCALFTANAQFNGPYTPANWNFYDYGTGVTRTVAPNGSSMTFNFSPYSEAYCFIEMAGTGSVSFSYAKTGDYSSGYFALIDHYNGVSYTPPGQSGTLSTVGSYPIQAGEVIEFYGGGGGTLPFSITISNFTAPGVVALPVTLTYFMGTHTAAGNQLSWHTAAEQNMAAFAIERSDDGKEFTETGRVAARNQPGNYSFKDAGTTAPVTYYRLKIMNTDGSFSYSNTLSMRNISETDFSVMAYPNPATDVLHLRVHAAATGGQAILTDVTGKTVKTQAIVGSNDAIDIRGISAGMYLLHYSDATHNETIKVNIR